jgi:hypothetical protein
MLIPTIQERFEKFHAHHPDVYAGLCALARKAKARGHKTFGIARIWEVMRWEVSVASDLVEEYKLSNSFRSRYSRLIMEQEPDLAGFFTTRELRSA